jgi:hypothetical protein
MALSVSGPLLVKASPTNQLVNPGFELAHEDRDWESFWLMGYRDNSHANTGSYSMQLYSNYVHQYFNLTGTTEPINTDGISEISFYYAGFTGGNTYYLVFLEYNDTYGGENFYQWSSLVPADSAWHRISLDLSGLPADVWCLQFTIYAGSGNPIWYDDLQVLYEYNPPAPGPSVSGSSLLDGDGDGTYVFVGPKLYTFGLDYEGNATGYELGFTSASGRVYSWEYNGTSGDVVNTSPDNGVSGTFTGTSVLNATTNRATFRLKFNLPIADSQNVTIYGRVYDAFGNDTGLQAGGLFNIYNLGGYATTDASGWAGRLYDVSTGQIIGDTFEIYAADSRTPYMIDHQNFGADGAFGMGGYGLWVWTLDPKTVLPGWEFLQANSTNGFSEIKRDHIAGDVPPYPYYPAIGLSEAGPSSLHLVSSDVSEYTTRASTNFRRKVTAETVTASYWVLAHTGSYAKVRLCDTDLYKTGGFEASTFEIKGLDMGYRQHSPTNFISLYNCTVDTWYKIEQIVNMTAQTQRVIIYDGLLNVLGDSGEVEVYQHLTYLNHWNVIGQDGGGPGSCDFYVDELDISSDFSGLYGGEVKSTMLFNNLQLWRQDFDFSIENGNEYTKKAYADYGYIELGLDYCVNGVWRDSALWARVNVTDSKIDSNNNYVKYSVQWYEKTRF